MNHFCISYFGLKNQICAGWYKNDLREGNWMKMKGTDLTIIESGWYSNNERVSDMKNNSFYPMFT